MRRRTVGAALLLVVALTVSAGGTSHAFFRVAVAGPAAATAGYATPRVVVLKGQGATFANIDITAHDVLATKAGTCRGKAFCTPLIGIGKTAAIKGVDKLKKGSYAFYCSLHARMKGTLIVQ